MVVSARRCIVVGMSPFASALAEHLTREHVKVDFFSSPRQVHFDKEAPDKWDVVFLSTDVPQDQLRNFIHGALSHNASLRVVLVDSHEKLAVPPSVVGAHSRVVPTVESIPLIAKYWAICEYLS